MGKRKISMEKISNVKKRNTTFTKRRKGLFQKAADLCASFGAMMAIIVISCKGNAYCFGYPTVDQIINHYYNNTTPVSSSPDARISALLDNIRDIKCKLKTEDARKKRQKKIIDDGGFWWTSTSMDGIESARELECMRQTLQELRDNLSKRITEISSSKSATVDDTVADIQDNVEHPMLAAGVSLIDHRSNEIVAVGKDIEMDAPFTTQVRPNGGLPIVEAGTLFDDAYFDWALGDSHWYKMVHEVPALQAIETAGAATSVDDCYASKWSFAVQETSASSDSKMVMVLGSEANTVPINQSLDATAPIDEYVDRNLPFNLNCYSNSDETCTSLTGESRNVCTHDEAKQTPTIEEGNLHWYLDIGDDEIAYLLRDDTCASLSFLNAE